MEIKRAIEFARLWRQGKLIGGDPYEVCAALLDELESLTSESQKTSKGHYIHTYTMPDAMLSVPLYCHLIHEPEDRTYRGWSERLTLDKAYAGSVDVYNLLDLHTIECIQKEALADLQKSRVEVD